MYVLLLLAFSNVLQVLVHLIQSCHSGTVLGVAIHVRICLSFLFLLCHSDLPYLVSLRLRARTDPLIPGNDSIRHTVVSEDSNTLLLGQKKGEWVCNLMWLVILEAFQMGL